MNQFLSLPSWKRTKLSAREHSFSCLRNDVLDVAIDIEKETDAMAISHTAAKFNDLWKVSTAELV